MRERERECDRPTGATAARKRERLLIFHPFARDYEPRASARRFCFCFVSVPPPCHLAAAAPRASCEWSVERKLGARPFTAASLRRTGAALLARPFKACVCVRVRPASFQRFEWQRDGLGRPAGRPLTPFRAEIINRRNGLKEQHGIVSKRTPLLGPTRARDLIPTRLDEWSGNRLDWLRAISRFLFEPTSAADSTRGRFHFCPFASRDGRAEMKIRQARRVKRQFKVPAQSAPRQGFVVNASRAGGHLASERARAR